MYLREPIRQAVKCSGQVERHANSAVTTTLLDDHLSGEPGEPRNVRQFNSCQENVREVSGNNRDSQGRLYVAKFMSDSTPVL